jgi:predicted CXXCH cytochrome family protein
MSPQLARYAVVGCTALIVAFAAGMFLSGHETMFMNAELAQAHASLEDNCSSCHQPWSGAAADRCIACHAPALFGKNHAGIDQACTTCHREHRGRQEDLKKVEVSQCLTCHGDVLAAARHPPETAQQCLFCHGQHTADTFARSVTSDLVMSHKTHVQDPGLVKAACELCHLPAPNPALVQYPLEPVCKDCHFGYTHDKTKDIRSKECLLCHAADHPIRITRAAGFATLRFSHAHHRAFACRECHAEMDMMASLAEITMPDVQNCKKCH